MKSQGRIHLQHTWNVVIINHCISVGVPKRRSSRESSMEIGISSHVMRMAERLVLAVSA